MFPFIVKVLSQIFGVTNTEEPINQALEGQYINLGNGLQLLPPDDDQGAITLQLLEEQHTDPDDGAGRDASKAEPQTLFYLVEGQSDTVLELLGVRLDTLDPQATPLIFLKNLGDFLSQGTRDPVDGFEVGGFDLSYDVLDRLVQVAVLAAEANGLKYRDFPESFQEFVKLPQYPFLTYLMVSLGEEDYEPAHMFSAAWKTGKPQDAVRGMKIEEYLETSAIALSLQLAGKDILWVCEHDSGYFDVSICGVLINSNLVNRDADFLESVCRNVVRNAYDALTIATLMSAAAATVFYLHNNR